MALIAALLLLLWVLLACLVVAVHRARHPVPADAVAVLRVLRRSRHMQVLWASTGLGKCGQGYPVLGRPVLTATGMSVPVRIAVGTDPDDWRGQTPALAAHLGALGVDVRDASRGRLRLAVRVRDTLADPIDVPDPRAHVDLTAVPVGVTEDLRPWTQPLLYGHTLVVGKTGAGKGSVLWSMVVGMAPSVCSGEVELWVIDPKGGMEFGAGAPLFTRFACDAEQAGVDVLTDAVTRMQHRAAAMRGSARKFVPTPGDPLIVVIVDEAAALSAYVADSRLRRAAASQLNLLLSQGRAVGVSVVLACQDPSKEVLTFRQLVPSRVALRLAEPDQVRMVLGAGARDKGAEADRIPDSQPGIGYVDMDGTADPVRVRAYYVSDERIASIAAMYAPVRVPAPVAVTTAREMHGRAQLGSRTRPRRVGVAHPLSPVEADPVEADPVEPSPVEPSPVEPSPVEPDPVEPELLAPRPVRVAPADLLTPRPVRVVDINARARAAMRRPSHIPSRTSVSSTGSTQAVESGEE